MAMLAIDHATPTPDEYEIRAVDTVALCSRMIDRIIIQGVPGVQTLYLKVNSYNASTISSITIVSSLEKVAFIVNIEILGSRAFDTLSAGGTTFRSILQSVDTLKILFDVRPAALLLHGEFRVKLAGVRDSQLMEVALRNPRWPKRNFQDIHDAIAKYSIKLPGFRIDDERLALLSFDNTVLGLPQLWRLLLDDLRALQGGTGPFWLKMISEYTKTQLANAENGTSAELTPWTREYIEHETELWNSRVLKNIDPRGEAES